VRTLSAWRARWERSKERPGPWSALLAALLVGLALLALTLGAVRVPLAELWPALADAGHPLHAVLFDVRLPRIAAAALVGAALSCAGALFQAVVRNPLADPGLLGVTSGAGVAVLLVIVLWPAATLWLPLVAFAGALVSLSVLVVAAWSVGTAPAPLRIILSGVALQAIGFGALALIQFFFADRAPAFVAFVIGSLNGISWQDVGMVIGPVAAGLVLALASGRLLNLLLFDDATASGVGLHVAAARLAVSVLAAFLAAAAVSVAGLVAFVGLVVPNGVRVVVGPDHRALVPLAALGGAALLLAADTLGRTAVAPLELPVGALLALLGGPYFLILLWRKLA